MTMIYGIKLNPFYLTIEKLCQIVRYKNLKSVFSKQMYGNHNLLFMVLYKEKLNLSWDRFIEHGYETNLPKQLGIKKMPVKSTFIDFVKRTPKKIFEQFVKSCNKLINNKNKIEASIDSTGFSNTNPSHHYCKRINKEVKNYTKTTFLTDNKTKLILNVKTVSDRTHDSKFFKPMVKELKNSLKLVLADKGYDSKENRQYCWNNNIEVHIPFRQWSKSRKQETGTPSKRRLAERKFDQTKYNQRALIESINSAIKRTLGSYVLARGASQQQKQITLKALTYNIERIGRTIKISIQMEIK